MLYAALIAPFADFEFMRRALAGSFALAFGAPPIGVFLMLRRMSLIGDAMAHAILPGAAIGFLFAGLSLFALAGGGLIAGFLIAIGAGLVARATPLKEDASLAAFFLVSLALGVTIVSVKGNTIDLMHFLFGSVLAIDNPTLVLILSMTSVSLVVLALIWRPLVLECVDPRHAACRRHHDAASGDLAVLGARHYRDDRRRGGQRRAFRLCRLARLLPREFAVRAGHYPGRGRPLCALGRGWAVWRPDLARSAAPASRSLRDLAGA
jgi:hypothetical protein